jgi:hypothetical protein
MDNNQWGNQPQNNWGGQPNNQNQWNQPQQNQWNQPQQNPQNSWGQPTQNNFGTNQWTQQPQNQWGTQPVNNNWDTQPQKKKKGCLFWGLLIGGIILFLIIVVVIGLVGLGFSILNVVENTVPDSGYETIIEDDDKDDSSSLFEDDDDDSDSLFEDDEEEDSLNTLFKGTWDLKMFTGAEGPTDVSAMSVRLNSDGTFRMDYAESDDYVKGTYTIKALNKDTNFDYAAEYYEIEMTLEDGSLQGKSVTTGSAEYEVVLLNDRKSTKFKDSYDIDGSFWMNTRSYNMYWSGNSSVEDILDNHSLSNMDLD